ncbi:MAG: hypothetical protein EHM30_09215 [Desulfobacteraceae bacterium]|nr:MAG: hypothetical protein EHM30_09215 [Desulfobacteraceae bacterium]
MQNKRFYAHSKEGRPPEAWQLLKDHLKNVAERAASAPGIFNLQIGHGMLHGSMTWGKREIYKKCFKIGKS